MEEWVGNQLDGSGDGWDTSSRLRAEWPVPRKSWAAWGGGTARAGSGGPELELPERAETLPEVAEGGRLEGNLAEGLFSLGPGRDSVSQATVHFGTTTPPRRPNTIFHFAFFPTQVLLQKAISEPPAAGNARTSGLRGRSASWESIEADAEWWREDALPRPGTR